MLTLRCTRKLLARLKQPIAAAALASSTLLGDWYANLLLVRPEQLVLLVAEKTLLPVVIRAAPIDGVFRASDSRPARFCSRSESLSSSSTTKWPRWRLSSSPRR